MGLQGYGGTRSGILKEKSLANWRSCNPALMSKAEARIELLVVIAVVARVVLALLQAGSGSLWYEGSGVVVLTLVALYAEFEVRKYGIEYLKPRSSISSGILVGAVTVPILLSGRLLQLQRCCSAHKNSHLAIDLRRFDFWLAVAGSMSMLLFLFSFLWKQKSSRWICSSILEYTCAVVLLVATLNRKSVWGGMDGVTWSVVYILGGKLLFSCVLKAFPFAGTVGEVMLVVQGIVLYGAKSLADSYSSSSVVQRAYPLDQDIINALLQGLILGILIIPLSLKLLYGILLSGLGGHPEDQDVVQKHSRNDKYVNYKAGLFCLLVLVVVFVAVPLWVGFVAGFRINPVLWSLQFIIRRPVPRLLFCVYWVVIICTPLPYLYRISTQKMIPKILVRKYYHVMIVFMFVPALVLEPRFLQLAFGVAFAGFLVVEMMRVEKLPPFGHSIEGFMTAFTDHRDSDSLIISHFSLLLGCALPVWLNSGPGDRPLAAYAGILSLGVLDTLASVVGVNYGSIRVSPNSKKTLEGTMAGIGALLVSVLLVMSMPPSNARPGGISDSVSLIAAVAGAGALEAYTLQLDNAFMPLLFYALLCL